MANSSGWYSSIISKTLSKIAEKINNNKDIKVVLISGPSSSGKTTSKKDLARIAMCYDNVYVASICLGGNMKQAIDALKDFVSKGIGEKNDIQRIQKIVSEYFQITVEDIRSKKFVKKELNVLLCIEIWFA